MQVGMIGLGRMGANMVRRFMRGYHQCVMHDVTAEVGGWHSPAGGPEEP